jgi:hypothetical protein
MPRIIGRLTNIGLGKETTRGTVVAPTYWVPVRDLDFDDHLEMKDNESGFGTIDAVQDSGILQQYADGGFGGKIFDMSEGLILSGVFGQAPTSVQRASSGTYDHTFLMLQNNQHRSLTVAIKEANNNLRYGLGMVDTYDLEATLDDFVHRDVGLKAKKGVTGSDTVATTNENEFLPKHMNVRFAAVAASTAATATALDGAANIVARSIKLSINKNAEILYALGSADANDVANKQLEITGSIEMYYDALTYRNLYFANTHQALRLEMLNTDVLIGATNNPALRFDLQEVVFTNWERGFDNNDIMTQTLEFKAVLNVAAGASIVGRLTNQYAGANYV